MSFFRGLLYPFRALSLLGQTPGLWGYVGIPVLVNVVLGAALYGGLLFAGLRWIDSVVSDATQLGAFVALLLHILLIMLLLIIISFLLVRFGVVLGSPWYSQLSERIEELRLGQAPPAAPLSVSGILYDVGRALLFEGQKLLVVVPVALLLLAANLIPAAGQLIGTIGGILLGTVVACFDFFDGPLERRRLSFGEKWRFVRRNLPASLGFGLVCFGLISIPLLNLLAIPLCVAAGTLFFCEQRALQIGRQDSSRR